MCWMWVCVLIFHQILVFGANEFTINPQNQYVAGGSNVTLTCAFNNECNGDIYWYVSKSPDASFVALESSDRLIKYSNSSLCMLVLFSFTEEDEGRYSCIYLKTHSSIATVTIKSVLDKFTINPKSHRVRPTESLGVTLTCAFNNECNHDIHWYVGLQKIDHVATVNQFYLYVTPSQCKLVISPVTKAAEGSYYCLESLRNISSSIADVIVLLDKFTINPKSQNVTEGSTLKLTCAFNYECNRNIDFLMHKSNDYGERFKIINNSERLHNYNHTVKCSLVISPVTNEDEGKYYCRYMDAKAEHKSSIIDVTVVKAVLPSCYIVKNTTTSTVDLICNSTVVSDTVEWLSVESFSGKHSLPFPHDEYNKTFTCVTTNVKFEERNCTVQLRAIELKIESNQTIPKVGSSASYECIAKASPPITSYVWKFQNKTIVNKINSSKNIHLNDNGRILHFHKLNAKFKSKIMICTVSNTIDTESVSKQIIFEEQSRSTSTTPFEHGPRITLEPDLLNEGSIDTNNSSKHTYILIGSMCVVALVLAVIIAVVLMRHKSRSVRERNTSNKGPKYLGGHERTERQERSEQLKNVAYHVPEGSSSVCVPVNIEALYASPDKTKTKCGIPIPSGQPTQTQNNIKSAVDKNELEIRDNQGQGNNEKQQTKETLKEESESLYAKPNKSKHNVNELGDTTEWVENDLYSKGEQPRWKDGAVEINAAAAEFYSSPNKQMSGKNV